MLPPHESGQPSLHHHRPRHREPVDRAVVRVGPRRGELALKLAVLLCGRGWTVIEGHVVQAAAAPLPRDSTAGGNRELLRSEAIVLDGDGRPTHPTRGAVFAAGCERREGRGQDQEALHPWSPRRPVQRTTITPIMKGWGVQ